jgi:hypothetical protein
VLKKVFFFTPKLKVKRVFLSFFHVQYDVCMFVMLMFGFFRHFFSS